MRLPRDWSGDDLIRRLAPLEYAATRQTGSHVCLTCRDERGEHHITIHLHANLRVGALNRILSDDAGRIGLSKDELLRLL